MIQLTMLTRWIGAGTQLDPYRLEVVTAFPDANVADIVGHPSANIPPSPNVVIALVRCPPATLQAIRAHPSYGPDAVLFVVDEQGDERQLLVTQAYYDRIVVELAKRFGRTQAVVRNALTTAGALIGQTRLQFWQKVITYLAARPKA